MKNSEIYRRTLNLSVRKMLLSFVEILLVLGLPVLLFVVTGANETKSLIYAGGGLVVAAILCGLISHFLAYLLEAGQIAMIARGVTEGSLPDNTYKAGKEAVKSRFATVAAFYLIYNLVRGITNQITGGVSRLTRGLGSGNDTAKSIGSVISLIIAIVLHYVCSCSMAWVFIHPDQSAFKSVCDGAVVYFQNWKALLKNLGKVLLIGFLSLALIAAPLTVGIHAVMQNLNGINSLLDTATVEINKVLADEDSEEASTQLDSDTVLWIICFILAIVVWAVVHSTFVEPYILITVLRTYIDAAEKNPPHLDIYEKLCGISKKFRSAFERSKEPAAV